MLQLEKVDHPEGACLQQQPQRHHHEREESDHPHPQEERSQQHVPVSRRTELSEYSRTGKKRKILVSVLQPFKLFH